MLSGAVGGRLLGREEPLAQLVEAIRVDHAIALVGESGIGKTSLIRAAVAATGRRLREGGAFATLNWRPYFALERAVDRPLSGEPSQAAVWVERVVGPDVLFVDDLQWADAGTRSVVEFLAGRIAFVTAIRSDDPGSAAALATLSAARCEILKIRGLDRTSATAVAQRMRPDLSDQAIARVVDRSGGNPLLIEELALRGRGSTSLARALLRQLDNLDADERQAVELLAVAGRPLPRDAIGRTGQRLIELGLVREEGEQITTRHALIAEAVVEGLGDDVKRDHHGRLAGILTDPTEQARHLAASGDRTAATEVAMAALATTTEPRARAALLAVAAETSDGPEEPILRVRAAQALWAIGDPAGAIRLLRDPITGPEELKALRSSVMATSLEEDGQSEEAWAEIEYARALRPDPSSEGAIELAITESTALVNAYARLGDATKIVERAARRAGAAAQGYRLGGQLEALRLYSGLTDQTSALEASWSESLAAGDGGAAAGIAMDLHYNLLALRGGAVARDFAFVAADRLAALGFATRSAELRAEAAQAAIFAGDLEGTVLHADRMLEAPLGRRSVQRLLYNRGLALALLGRFQDAERTFVEVEPIATDDFDGRGSVLWCWAESSYWSGLPGRARQQAESALALSAFNDSEYVLPGLTRAWAEVELGRRPSPLPAAVAFRFHAGAVPEFQGLDALAVDDLAHAFAAFDEAAVAWRGFHAPRELLCKWAAGETARRAGLKADALERLTAALDGAVTIGFEPLAARARRSLRQAGQRPGPTPSTRPGGGLLTPREREVLGLVERGLNNTEIARQLGLGRPTVARMLSNAMLKLGAETRAQAVALAADAV